MRRLLRKAKKRFHPFIWAWQRRKESLTHGLPPYSEILLLEKELESQLAIAERNRVEKDVSVLNGKLEIISWLKRYDEEN